MSKSDVIFFILAACIFATMALRILVVNLLRKDYSDLYTRLGGPSALGGMGFLAFRIAFSTEFKLFKRRDAIVVRLMQATWISEIILLAIYVATIHFG